MKHVPNGREESLTAWGWDPRTQKKPARDRDPRTREKEHGQQQADEVLLRIPEQPSVTEQREREACADVPEDVPQSENVDEFLPMVQEGRGRLHARSNPEVPAEQQWDSEAQGPEHDGAHLEQVTCLPSRAQTCSRQPAASTQSPGQS